MKMLKLAAMASVAIALAGCGDTSPDAKSSAGFAPIVPDGSVVAVKYAKSDSPSAKLLRDAAKKQRDEALKAVASETSPVGGGQDIAQFLKDSGLDEADISWWVLSCGALSPAVVSGETMPPVAAAISFSHDFDKILGAFKALAAKGGDADAVKTLETAGAKAFMVDVKEGSGPCVASIGGQLLIAALTKEALETEVSRYKSGAQSGGAFAPFVSDKQGVWKILIPEVGKLVRDAQLEGQLAMVDSFVPNGKAIVLGLKSLDAALNAEPGLAVRIRLETAKADDAKTLETMLNGVLMPLRAQSQQAEDEDDKLAAELLAALKVSAEGTVLKIDLPLSDEQVKRGLEMAEKNSSEALGLADGSDEAND